MIFLFYLAVFFFFFVWCFVVLFFLSFLVLMLVLCWWHHTSQYELKQHLRHSQKENIVVVINKPEETNCNQHILLTDLTVLIFFLYFLLYETIAWIPRKQTIRYKPVAVNLQANKSAVQSHSFATSISWPIFFLWTMIVGLRVSSCGDR